MKKPDEDSPHNSADQQNNYPQGIKGEITEMKELLTVEEWAVYSERIGMQEYLDGYGKLRDYRQTSAYLRIPLERVYELEKSAREKLQHLGAHPITWSMETIAEEDATEARLQESQRQMFGLMQRRASEIN